MNRNFRTMQIWQNSYSLALDLYKMTNRCLSEDKEIASQLRRAALSMPLNIAEGSAAVSDKVFFNQLAYAYQSTKEVNVLLQFAHDLRLIPKEEYGTLQKKLDKVTAQTYQFLVYMQKKTQNSWKPGYGNELYWKEKISHKVAVGELIGKEAAKGK